MRCAARATRQPGAGAAGPPMIEVPCINKPLVCEMSEQGSASAPRPRGVAAQNRHGGGAGGRQCPINEVRDVLHQQT